MPQEHKLYADLPDYADVLNESEKVLAQCLKQYELDQIFVSFNGGKDCTALLDLFIEIVRRYKPNFPIEDLKVVYIRTNGPFREIETFVKEIENCYGVKMKVMEGDMKETLTRLLEEDKRLKACLMGTRRSDPYSEDLNYMQKTDPTWPQLVRVSPLLNWSYHQIWSYILRRRVPYCSLYDKGYTSIGSTHNTHPNPSLSYMDSCGHTAYNPAWRLEDGSLERAGRGTNPLKTSNGHELCDNIKTCITGSKSEINGHAN